MKVFTTIGVLLLGWIAMLAQEPVFEWMVQFGGNTNNIGQAIDIDNTGNVYSTGGFSTTTDFDPGPDVFPLTVVGVVDIYVSKLDSNGDFLWARSVGSVTGESGYAISADENGNVYVTGYFKDTVDFDPGPSEFTLSSKGENDIFVLKLDELGNFLWAVQLGGENSEVVWASDTDADGNIYLTGEFNGTVDFDPGPGIHNLTTPSGADDVFICKMNPAGQLVWVGQIGGVSFDQGFSIDMDDDGNIYTTGRFRDTVDFDPGPAVFEMVSDDTWDIFISKLDTEGSLIWAKSFDSEVVGNSNPWGSGFGIAVDGQGNVFTTGNFSDITDFDPGPEEYLLSTGKRARYFYRKIRCQR